MLHISLGHGQVCVRRFAYALLALGRGGVNPRANMSTHDMWRSCLSLHTDSSFDDKLSGDVCTECSVELFDHVKDVGPDEVGDWEY